MDGIVDSEIRILNGRKLGRSVIRGIRGRRTRTRDDRETKSGGKWKRRRMDSKKETIKREEDRERERAPFLPSMPVLGHVKYANCGYAEALLVLVLPSTNYISFGRVYVCSPRPMGTRRIPRVYAPCPKTVHTVKYTRAPTLLSLSPRGHRLFLPRRPTLRLLLHLLRFCRS